METKNDIGELLSLGFDLQVARTINLTSDKVKLLDLDEEFAVVVDMRWKGEGVEKPIALFTKDRFFIVDDPDGEIENDQNLKSVWEQVKERVEKSKPGDFETTGVRISSDEESKVIVFEVCLDGDEKLPYYQRLLA